MYHPRFLFPISFGNVIGCVEKIIVITKIEKLDVCSTKEFLSNQTGERYE